MPHNDDFIRLRHMLDATEELLEFTAGKTLDDLIGDRALQHISLHCLEIIGEAANNIGEEFREAHSEIPWRPIIAMRHRLIHGYFDVELSIIWDTISLNIPMLVSQLRAVLATEG